MMVIAANWSLDTGIRPALVLLALTESVAVAGALRRLATPRPEPQPRFA
jgi:hypothetical protein